MRILFVFKDIREENLGVMYISQMLKDKGYDTGVIEADYGRIAQQLRDRVPTVLAFSTLAFYCDFYIKLSAEIKKNFDVLSVFGGQHPTGKPDIIESDGVDVVCRGEGEYPFVELVEAFFQGRDYTRIPNLWVKKNQKIYKNTSRPLREDLDSFPFPDRSLFQRKAPFFHERINMITSRGCNYDCPYCYNHVLRKLYASAPNIYRRRSVDNVLAELREIKKNQKVNFILFHDDIFILMPEWVKEFAEKYGSEFQVPFSCNIRIELITERLLRLLKQAGCHSVSFGLESGNDRVRKDILRRKIDKEKIIETCRLIKNYGFLIRTTNMIGASTDSLDADFETLRLNIQCGADMVRSGILSFYPGTDIKNSCIDSDNKWAVYKEVDLPPGVKTLSLFSKNIAGRYKRRILMLNGVLEKMSSRSQQRKIINFHALFPLIVRFPFLFPFTRLLISLPLGPVYVKLSFIWGNYCSLFRIYKTGVLSFIEGVIAYRKKEKRFIRANKKV